MHEGTNTHLEVRTTSRVCAHSGRALKAARLVELSLRVARVQARERDVSFVRAGGSEADGCATVSVAEAPAPSYRMFISGTRSGPPELRQ